MSMMSHINLSDIADHVWWKIKKREIQEDWILQPKPAKILRSFGLADIADANLQLNNGRERNIHLRSSISAYIKGNKKTRSIDTDRTITAPQFFDWIVYEWGNIPEGSREIRQDKFELWADELNEYTDRKINSFYVRQKHSGISSWSKIISFVDYRYPIFDTRVSAALNIALEDLWEELPQIRFHMPTSTSKTNKACIDDIRDKWNRITNSRNRYKGYDFYISLLDMMITKGCFQDRLHAEMHIFGVSKEMIDEYIAENNIEVPK